MQLINQTLRIHYTSYNGVEICFGQLFWPSTGKEVDDLYKNCRACKTKGISKMHKTGNVVPQLAPGEVMNIDFFKYNQQDILVIKNKQTGYIGARLYPNQMAQAAYDSLLPWFYSY